MITFAVASKKAVENLEAAKILRDKKSFNNASVSRAYYAAAQTTAAFLLHHKQFPQKPNHAKVQISLGNLLRKNYPKHQDLTDDLTNLESLRYDADYENREMTPKIAQQCCKLASKLKNDLLQLVKTP